MSLSHLKSFILCLFILTGSVQYSFASVILSNSEIDLIKKAMIRSIESPAVTDSLYSELKERNSTDPLIRAYIGTLEALKAKHSWNPYNKVRFVTLSSKTMKEAVSKAPDNMEIRFMRFSIQHYTPAFLGFSKDLDEDRKVIYQQFRAARFGSASKQLIKSIAGFMLETGRCSREEALLFKKYA